ncbi:MAG: DUF5906 domain-containing protein, partial [Gammaproteobacteria bacterium]|nr:DUF5906 domain-containing protein [Gammaproteobacteria bacterium]
HLRHKILHPEVPGPAIVNVAHDGSGRELEGSGRNRLTHILKRLFGGHHVKDLQFSDVLSVGRGGWNDWIEHSLCAVISEVADTSSRGDYRERRRQMDFLKTLVEPGAEEVQRRKRNTDDANVTSYVSWFFNTNHIDALPILEQSRRFAVLENPCAPMDSDFAAELMTWMKAPENIGAFKQALIAFESELATYSPYAPPPVTAAKLRMVEAHQNDLDEAFEQIFSVLTEGLLCKEMILAVLEDPSNGWDLPTGYKGVVAGEFRRRGLSLKKSVISSGQIRLRQDSPALKLTGTRETHLGANRRLIMRALDRHDEWLRCHATEKWHESADGNWNRLIKAG